MEGMGDGKEKEKGHTGDGHRAYQSEWEYGKRKMKDQIMAEKLIGLQ